MPADWKESYIEPNPKVPSQAVLNNYFRPISFLSILSKFLEKHVFTLIEEHLEMNGSLSDCKWDFRAGRPTTSALLSVTSHWFEIGCS